jgi:RNA recognition motif-containing protein
LPWSCGDEDVSEMFTGLGLGLISAEVSYGRDGRSRGYARVQTLTAHDAKTAIANLSGYTIEGRELFVKVSGGGQLEFVALAPTSFPLTLSSASLRHCSSSASFAPVRPPRQRRDPPLMTASTARRASPSLCSRELRRTRYVAVVSPLSKEDFYNRVALALRDDRPAAMSLFSRVDRTARAPDSDLRNPSALLV